MTREEGLLQLDVSQTASAPQPLQDAPARHQAPDATYTPQPRKHLPKRCPACHQVLPHPSGAKLLSSPASAARHAASAAPATPNNPAAAIQPAPPARSAAPRPAGPAAATVSHTAALTPVGTTAPAGGPPKSGATASVPPLVRHPGPPVRPGVMTGPKAERTTRCPFCRELILVDARKCKHCGEYLTEAQAHVQAEQATGQAPPLMKTIVVAGVCAAIFALGLVSAAMLFRGRGGDHPDAAPAAVAAAQVEPPAKSGSAAGNAALEAMAQKLERSLQGTNIQGADGTLTFLRSDLGGVPWRCELQKTWNPKKPLKGSVTIPFRWEGVGANRPSAKGRYVLDFVPAGSHWELDAVLKEVHAQSNGGGECAIPEEDRTIVKQRDQDPVVAHLKKCVALAGESAD